MNDPNGMVLHEGTYHLLLQHNPPWNPVGQHELGTRHFAGPPALGRAAARHLAGFDDQGRAVEDIFSGSVVSDPTNSSGLGTAQDPPLVVFPEAGARSIGVWATGGQAQLKSLTVTSLAPAMWGQG